MKVVIWGLKSMRHSHRYIHAGFYDNFKKLGYETSWVDDSELNMRNADNNCLIVAVNVASKFLPVHKSNRYILHNMDPLKLGIFNESVSLQVATQTSDGIGLGIPRVSWNETSRTLFQPWGIPTDPETWRQFTGRHNKKEYWIGSVWNNTLAQGNKTAIENYKKALANHGLTFSKIGGTKWFTKGGISESRGIKLLSTVPIGAAVVGEWQKENKYVPCRLFKNISAGKIPSSNSNFGDIFSDDFIYEDDLNLLISKVLGLPSLTATLLVKEAQETMKKYSYRSNIHRILDVL